LRRGKEKRREGEKKMSHLERLQEEAERALASKKPAREPLREILQYLRQQQLTTSSWSSITLRCGLSLINHHSSSLSDDESLSPLPLHLHQHTHSDLPQSAT